MKAIHQTPVDAVLAVTAAPPPQWMAGSSHYSSDRLAEVPITGNESLEHHRARHMANLYGSLLTSEGLGKFKTWVVRGPGPLLDEMREVIAAIDGTRPCQTTTKETFVERPVAEPPKRDRNRIKIDWNSTAAFEALRDKRDNPMDQHVGASLPGAVLPVDDPTKPKRKGAIRPRGVNLNAEESERAAAQLELMKAAHRAGSDAEGLITTLPDGSTLYRSRAMLQPKHMQTQPNRVVATFRPRDTSNWLPTMRDHIRNHGIVQYERLTADKHPAVALVTASLGLVVPELKPLQKPSAAVMSRPSAHSAPR